MSNGNCSLVVKGVGVELYDLDGWRFIDFVGVIGMLNVGYLYFKVVEVVKW